ncbi:hypothetical protein GC105_00570 [Alkalibaculum sp. M08DMB]|uniref:Uncharacterized protein n=1 Tax=Alkalibaculum sporogenes TaxID=2655001 RepID=A0A6A7K4H6_9FIRM|nr:hypothetical protein [Alkalibaculum sporogenes]MPW24288.1 hypothetical protein [Alkalibaculum sporogenes]
MDIIHFIIITFLLIISLYVFFPVSTDPIRIFNLSEEKENRNIKMRIILGLILFILFIIVYSKFYFNGQESNMSHLRQLLHVETL